MGGDIVKIMFVPVSPEDGTFDLEDVRIFEVQGVTIMPTPHMSLNYDRYQEEPGGDPVFRISEVEGRTWTVLSDT